VLAFREEFLGTTIATKAYLCSKSTSSKHAAQSFATSPRVRFRYKVIPESHTYFGYNR